MVNQVETRKLVVTETKQTHKERGMNAFSDLRQRKHFRTLVGKKRLHSALCIQNHKSCKKMQKDEGLSIRHRTHAVDRTGPLDSRKVWKLDWTGLGGCTRDCALPMRFYLIGGAGV